MTLPASLNWDMAGLGFKNGPAQLWKPKLCSRKQGIPVPMTEEHVSQNLVA